MRTILLACSLGISLWSCDPMQTDPAGNTQAYVPVYMNAAQLDEIMVMPPKSTSTAGKIYAYGNYVFQNDVNEGIHIIDNTDKNKPVKIAFLKIPSNTEIAIKGKYLYANSYVDLVVIDMADAAKPKLVKRLPGIFPSVSQDYPPFTNTSFVCADKSKGIVVRWELKTVDNPKCRR